MTKDTISLLGKQLRSDADIAHRLIQLRDELGGVDIVDIDVFYKINSCLYEPKQFPKRSQHFGVRHRGFDNSYSADIFVCDASDEHKVVAHKVTGFKLKDNTYVFDRTTWNIQELSDSVLNAVRYTGNV